MTEERVIRSYVCNRWHRSQGGFVAIRNPSTEEVIGEVSSEGIDFSTVLEFGRGTGGDALRKLTFAQRAGLLKEISKALRTGRDELLELSRLNNGTTQSDGAFDIDGATGTLAYYAHLGSGLGDVRVLVEGDRAQLSRGGSFIGGHVLTPRSGVAVHINAFNFPAWGFAEKAACALLAGMPVITKPATATARVTERCVELIIDAGILPEGVLQMVCGSLGDLLSQLGSQDVVAFTGSAETAERVRAQIGRQGVHARFNVEADSLNAAILAPDVGAESATMDLFVRDVVREMTQKSGQKCTAVRRILVPEAVVSTIENTLHEQLEEVVVGDPSDDRVVMGPLATKQQLEAAESGVATLAGEAKVVTGSGRRIDGTGAESGKGYFFAPTLLRAEADSPGSAVHDLEVFAPVATLIPYGGSVEEAVAINRRAEGTLVTSIYSDDTEWVEEFVTLGAGTTGRLYIGSADSAEEAPGSGVALPQSVHGGPGRAGGGEELGGLTGVKLYLQRMAVQGSPQMLDAIGPGTEEGD